MAGTRGEERQGKGALGFRWTPFLANNILMSVYNFVGPKPPSLARSRRSGYGVGSAREDVDTNRGTYMGTAVMWGKEGSRLTPENVVYGVGSAREGVDTNRGTCMGTGVMWGKEGSRLTPENVA